MDDLVKWTHRKIKKESRNDRPNGIIALKGGDLTDELRPYAKNTEVIELKNYFDEAFFETKKLVYYHP
jgi:16S rRNA (guanine527-N7)-methyltransferase